MIRAAGIMFVTDDGETLLLKRGPGGDWPGAWCFPGGEAKEGETLEETAERETIEELGFLPKGEKRVWTRRISNNQLPDFQTQVDPMPEEKLNPVPPFGEPVDYTTFVQRVKEHFEPELNGEHTGFAWCKLDEPPEPLHPGAAVSLKRMFMDELQVAKCIRDGELVSPQHFENVWLFALRITGTGTAYRRRLDEYVYRKPENYLTSEFLERCNGLPVIWEHPEAGKLDGKEFADRIIGTILLPYIQGDEVWGIAKIYDDGAANLMATKQLSTSPAVVFRHTDGNVHAKLENGHSLLVEGKPSLLDHLAICEEGVWDKGGDPAGVELSTSKTSGGENMPDVEKEVKVAEERADAETGNIDKLLMGIDALCDRLDAMEKRMDSMSKARDDENGDDKGMAKADEDEESKMAKADEDEPEMAKADEDAGEGETSPAEPKEMAADEDQKMPLYGSRKDSAAPRASNIDAHVMKEVRRLAQLVGQMPKVMGDADYAAMADYQARADDVYGAFGERAPAPLQGETPNAYRIRLAKGMQRYSAAWKEVPLRDLPNNALEIAERQIYVDASAAARSPANVDAGSLRAIRKRDASDRMITEFVGEPSAWMGEFRTAPRSITKPFFRPRQIGG
jgi:8-oxo-dGTP pyrophosphatase MutT (NUDIX family)